MRKQCAKIIPKNRMNLNERWARTSTHFEICHSWKQIEHTEILIGSSCIGQNIRDMRKNDK